jgi:hypothetical protein
VYVVNIYEIFFFHWVMSLTNYENGVAMVKRLRTTAVNEHACIYSVRIAGSSSLFLVDVEHKHGARWLTDEFVNLNRSNCFAVVICFSSSEQGLLAYCKHIPRQIPVLASRKYRN